MKSVRIFGGGFSGLTLAWYLATAGAEVEIHERSSRLGGLLGTRQTPFGMAETAANAFVRTPEVEAMFRELNLVLVPALKSSRRRYFWRGHLQQWPLHFFETLGFALKFTSNFVFRKKNLPPLPSETVQQWGQRNLGGAATDFLLAPALQGIYAGDAQKLSAGLILEPLFQKRKKYRGSVACEKGMQQWIDALEFDLRSKGVKMHLNSEAELDLDSADIKVLATSVRSAAKILEKSVPELSKTIAGIHTASLISVTVFYKTAQTKRPGFGCLIPRGHSLRTLGVLMNSYIFSNRDRTYNETFILGGATDPQVLELSDQELKQLIRDERQIIFGQDLEILHCEITRWPQALPHYDLELEKLLPKIKAPARLYLHGNYLKGIGLSKILDRSKQLAEEILKA